METVVSTNPNERLLDNRVDDNVVIPEGEQEVLCLRIFAKRHVVVIFSLFAFLVLAFGSTLGGIYITRQRAVVTFKGNLTQFLEEKFTLLDPKERANHVVELTDLFSNGYITDDHVAELEVLLEFNDFNRFYSRKHADAEERRIKLLTFRERYNAVKAQTGEESYEKGINQFSDMTEKEFEKFFPPIPLDAYRKVSLENSARKEDEVFTPEHLEKLRVAKGLGVGEKVTTDGEDIDWRRCNGVTPVKDQGNCGSCWAFAAVGAVESLYLLKKGETLDLSEQELINCEDSNLGCRGGLCNRALDYIRTNGITYSKDVPYHAAEEKCALPASDRVYIDHVLSNDGLDILNKALSRSPTTVYISVSQELTAYKGGIYTGSCGDTLNHAALLVGEGHDKKTGKRYWIIKNSWGPNWGENGYFRLERTGGIFDKCSVLRAGFTPDL